MPLNKHVLTINPCPQLYFTLITITETVRSQMAQPVRISVSRIFRRTRLHGMLCLWWEDSFSVKFWRSCRGVFFFRHLGRMLYVLLSVTTINTLTIDILIVSTSTIDTSTMI